MSGFAYFYRTYTATVSGSTTRRERCAGCSRVFEYVIKRTAAGGGHSAFWLNNAGAAVSADTRARSNLQRMLNEAVEPVPCPTCGIFQPNMVAALRQQLGKQCEPNKYASERIAIPAASAWRDACSANTVQAYRKFIEVWPTYSWHAEQRIREIKHPILRKVTSSIFWIVWGVVASFFLLLMVLSWLSNTKYFG